MLYKEYHSLKSKAQVEGSKVNFGTDSKNTVFGAHLNKRKSTEKKSFFSLKSNKSLDWSKHQGWTTFQKVPSNSNPLKSDCIEKNEVYIRI